MAEEESLSSRAPSCGAPGPQFRGPFAPPARGSRGAEPLPGQRQPSGAGPGKTAQRGPRLKRSGALGKQGGVTGKLTEEPRPAPPSGPGPQAVEATLPVAHCGTPVVHCTPEPRNRACSDGSRRLRGCTRRGPAAESSMGALLFPPEQDSEELLPDPDEDRPSPPKSVQARRLQTSINSVVFQGGHGAEEQPPEEHPLGEGAAGCIAGETLSKHRQTRFFGNEARSRGVRLYQHAYITKSSIEDVMFNKSGESACDNIYLTTPRIAAGSALYKSAAGKPSAGLMSRADVVPSRKFVDRNRQSQCASFWKQKEQPHQHLQGQRPLRRQVPDRNRSLPPPGVADSPEVGTGTAESVARQSDVSISARSMSHSPPMQRPRSMLNIFGQNEGRWELQDNAWRFTS